MATNDLPSNSSEEPKLIEGKIEVHPDSDRPDVAWTKIKKGLVCKSVNPLPLDTPIYEDKVRFVCISDTHDKAHKMTHKIPDADVLIHAGDFTRRGRVEEVKRFVKFLNTLTNIKHKIVVAGNHEFGFDLKLNNNKAKKDEIGKNHLTDCIYLEDSGLEIYGIKIYGAPWTPRYRDWAFNANRGDEILSKWNKIPSNTDILITHGPPLGYLDRTESHHHVGCCELLSTIQKRVKPLYHVFGHIHESHGIVTDSVTTFINAAISNKHYQPVNAPFIFDIPLPAGVSKILK